MKSTLNILFIAFIFVTLHTSLHNPYDHNHDSHCSVYVLEQLYFSADIVTIDFIFALFIPFIFLPFKTIPYQNRIQNYFNIRAPPLT